MKNKITKKWLKNIFGLAGILFIVSLTIFIFTEQTFLSSLRIVFGSVYVLFLPGFLISYIFFPKTKEFEDSKIQQEDGTIDWIERIALSFALSVAIVPLVVFYLNLIGLKISVLSSFFSIFGILLVSAGILYHRYKRKILRA